MCNEASSFLDGDHAAELNAHNHLEKDDEHSLDDLYGVAQRRLEIDSRRSAIACLRSRPRMMERGSSMRGSVAVTD